MRPKIALVALSIALSTLAPALAQNATERFIPLGESPGLSRVATEIGQIEALDRAARSLKLTTPSNSLAIKVSPETRIWLDKSRFRLATEAGSFEDLRIGRTVEVKLDAARDPGVAEWIKVVPEEPE